MPRSLGSIEKDYREYRDIELDAKRQLKDISSSLSFALEQLVVKDDIEIAAKDFRSKAAILHAKIRKLATKGRQSLKDEQERFEETVSAINKAFHEKVSAYLTDLDNKKIGLKQTLELIELDYQIQDIEVTQKLSPYISAFENLKEQIDLESLAIVSVNENSRLKKQVEQVNALAQLGITVEIIGHEIEGFDMTIERGIKNLSSSSLDPLQKSALLSITNAHESLSDSWRFLSPLKLSGEKVRALLTGLDIYTYVNNFFKNKLENDSIYFRCTSDFEKLAIYEQPSRIYPVFINLVNNSRYWVKETETLTKEILFDVKDGIVYVSDTGPGVDMDDVDELFTIFFSKKQRGGRGVGLYLCKQNLAVSGHSIFYETRDEKKILNGANFAIIFKGLKNAN
ncbi:ATP-binding protein [Pantoea sp. OXWO6B1]|uniref:ATP-binding protein n=1 Tax=Pantoea sp. OXWO6B1 TaxID=1835724 RepID=UPI000AB50EFE|nr:ATP-binding protein [Pantoea sp. OXWO6B1]